MALNVRWSEEALASLNNLYDYLEAEWPEQVIRSFSANLESKIKLISEQPRLFKASDRLQGTRECILTKHNTIFLLNRRIMFILFHSGATERTPSI